MSNKINRFILKNLGFIIGNIGVVLVMFLKNFLIEHIWFGIIPSCIIMMIYVLLFTAGANENPKAHWIARRICKNDVLLAIIAVILCFGIVTDTITVLA